MSARRLRCAVGMALVAMTVAGAACAQNLYWIDTNYGAPTLNRSDPNGFGVTTVALPAATLPEGLAAEPNGRTYFVESAWSNARVERVGLNLVGIAPIVTGGSALRGIAVDDVSQLLYWTTSNLATGAAIMRSDITGAGVTTLVTLPPGSNPRGIAVDHVGGSLYWADFDLNAIYRANLDGTQAAPWIGLLPASGPWGVAVDALHQLVFWTEFNSGQIKRITTGGSSELTLEAGLANPTYLAVDVPDARIYWSEAGGSPPRLARATTAGGSPAAVPVTVATFGGVAFSPGALVATPEALPTEFALALWPTPARGAVHVSLALPRATSVRVRVLDLQGREMARLIDGALPPGRIERQWTPGAHVAPGLYFVRLDAEGRQWTRRVVLAR